MRIAISGTHCSGKSTLIDQFLIAHPDFTHEPEPYEVLADEFGESFPAQPMADDFFRQLKFNLERLNDYQQGDRVIFERCPIDFLAYMLALRDLDRDRHANRIIDTSLVLVEGGLRHLDLIAFASPGAEFADAVTGEEDLELRHAVDVCLTNLIENDDFDLFATGGPAVLTLASSTAQRVLMLEQAFSGRPN